MNTEFKGTPGPWEVMKGDVAFAVKSGDEYVVRGGCGCCNGFDDSIDEEADAHLIAAAPDLLEALQKVDELLGYVEHYNNFDARILDKCQDRIRDAIAKALGQREEDKET